ncbi:Alanine--tRNA ligase [bioreactor metagenome]|uniref:Alanine--tRNA ligase n=1 Tax=bioreactor metagenome TaxID=1076179 RepID=A0A645FET8_9ZZZZ
MNLDDAKQSGATALFDEKYESKVRVVTMGDVSKELCGGTHVTNTSDVGIFKIVSEESIGSGIRRITSLSGYGAYQEFLAQEDKLIAISKLLKTGSLSNVTEKTEQLIQENHDLQETISGMTNRLMNLKAEELLSQIVVKNDLNIIISEIKDADSSNLKTIIDNLKNKINNSVLFLYNISNDKVVYTVYCSPEAIRKGLKAGELAKEAAILSGGGGGGRPDLAQSGGKDITKIEQVLQVLANKLGLTI